jgi:outer membrane protein OmpA-like peptidoglycan-associated protein
VAKPAIVRSGDSAPGGGENPSGRFAELRSLLVGPEQRQLRALQTRLDDPGTQAREVSQVLPQAVQLRNNDPQLKRALAPAIEEGIASLVRRDPRQLADALFPAIMPAIRKAIAATLSGMLESVNRTLEHSLSVRSIKWRITAARTGKSFAEIVLLNTLLYRVEQVFLIHRKTGLLLQHVKSGPASVQDADLVSGMLTAIRDFVEDSFRVPEGESLDTLQVGELSVWIEQGPHAILAAVIRGTAPPDLRAKLQETLESLHAHFADELKMFDGDAARFERARPLLEECLQAQYRREPQKRKPFVWVLAGALVLAAALWMFFAWQARSRWNAYLQALRAEPGIVVVSTDRRDGRYVLTGLRDPLARDPASLLAPSQLEPSQVEGRWQLYQAIDPAFVLARANQVLQPPAGVALSLDGTVLSASGVAPAEWIGDSVRVARALPGVTQFDASRSIDASIRALVDTIDTIPLLFVKGTTTFVTEGEGALDQQLARLRELDGLAKAGDRRFRIDLVGQADSDGPPEMNLPLSRRRADRVLEVVAQQRFDRVTMVASGVGSRDAASPQSAESEKQRNRRVSFHVTEVSRGEGAPSR